MILYHQTNVGAFVGAHKIYWPAQFGFSQRVSITSVIVGVGRLPLVISDGVIEQFQAGDIFQLHAGADPQLILEVKDAAGASTFEIRVDLAASENTLIGLNAGASITSGSGLSNTLIGKNAGDGITTTVAHVALGADALSGGIYGNGVIAIGSDALLNVDDGMGGGGVDVNVVAIGRDVGEDATSIGANSVLIGPGAGSGTGTNPSVIGSNCFIMGSLAGFESTLGNFTVAIGQNALRRLNSGTPTECGTSCFALGRDAGRSLNDANASNNIFIGNQSGNNALQLTTATNSIAIGLNSFTTANNQIVLGGTAITETILRGDVEIQNGTNAQTLFIYNTFTNDTDHELLAATWSSDVATIETQKGSGGGTARALALGTDGTTRITIGASGDFTIADGENFILNATTGTEFGTAVTQKLAFWGLTPIVQPAAANQAALINNTGGTRDGTLAPIGDTTAVDQGPALNNNLTDIHELLKEIRTALVNAGLIKGAA